MKLSSFLFEETTEKSNEETIANVVLGIEKSTDPEDLEFDVEKQDLEDFEADVVADDALFEATAKPKNPAAIRLGQTDKKFFEHLLEKVRDVFVLQKIERGFFRIQPTEKLKTDLAAKEIAKEKFEEILSDAKNTMFDLLPPESVPPHRPKLDVKIIGKGEAGSGSGTFTTYVVRDTDDKSQFHNLEIKIIICAGGNQGHKFEAQFKNEIETATGENWLNLVCFLIQKDLITEVSEIKDYNFVGKQQVRRSLTVENQFEIQNIGEKISDLTLFLYGDRKIYVSLKAEKGQTFANLGVAGIFTPKVLKNKKNSKSIVEVNYSADSTFISLMEALGVNIDDIKMGFEAYGDGLLGKDPKYSQKIQNILEANGQKAIDYLVAQLGYGYVYFRRTTSGGYRIFNLDTANAARKLVGEFDSGKVSYPYYLGKEKNKKSKQCTIELTTTTTVYTIQIRSSKGLKQASSETEETEETEIVVGDAPTENQIAAAKSFLDSLESKVTVKKFDKTKDFVCTDRNISLKRTVPDAYWGVVENKHIKNSFKLSKYLF